MHTSTNRVVFLVVVEISIRLKKTEVIPRVNLIYFYLLGPKVEILFDFRL